MGDPTAIIFGHSYIKRYDRWIGSYHHMAPASRAHVCPRITDLEMLGISGLMSSSLQHDDYVFQCSKHDIVLIDCGTNDLASGVHHEYVVNNVLCFARRCIADGSKLAHEDSTPTTSQAWRNTTNP